MKKILKQKKGVTLIALVITIIVLLILAGISISMLSGDNGILHKAAQSKEKTERAEIIEIAQMDIIGKQAQNHGNLSESELEEILISNNYNTKGTLSNEESILDRTLTSSNGKYQIPVSEIYNGSLTITDSGETPIGPTGKPLINKDTVSNYVSGTDPLVGEDRYGNSITIPVGFKVAEDSGEDVTQGIVIEDNDLFVYNEETDNEYSRGNQYVWIPTGNIYTDTAMTPSNVKTIIPGRYEFANGTKNYTNEDGSTTTTIPTKGTPILKQSLINYAIQPTNITYNSTSSFPQHGIISATNSQIVINNYYYELSTYSAGIASSGYSGKNRTANNLSSFANSVATNHGYYIARYEASWGIGDKVKSRISSGTPLASSGSRTNGQLWNFITEIKAAEYCQNIYSGINSDLMNSYAWDTAIVYIQMFSGDEDYSFQISLNTESTPANTGKNNDELCKINDMASNVQEWTTEYSTQQPTNYSNPCVFRGGLFGNGEKRASSRSYSKSTDSDKYRSFRSMLYM